MSNNNNHKKKNNNNNENSQSPNNKPLLSASGQLKRVSHSLSWALRHAALDLGWTMSNDGYVPIAQVLACKHKKFQNITLEQIQQVVQTNDKQRFKIQEFPASKFQTTTTRSTNANDAQANNDNERMILCIRANQGHTISNIDPDALLTRLTPEQLEQIPVILHGTYLEPWKAIQKEGLKSMNRNHIHFAAGLPEEDGVISGMRRSCNVYIYVDPAKCAKDGVVFYRSDNGVLLTSGLQSKGILPTEYFLYVIDSSQNILLDNRI